MRIDESHRPWAVAGITILTVAVILWFPYAVFYPGGPNGNTWPGLLYGVAGYGMMLFAGLMGARKKVPLWRIGRGQTWMRGHLYLGFLSFPMILLHSAFSARGPLTMVMMTLLVITWLSGVAGALLQHFVPKRITALVPLETIYEQIPEVREQLFAEASDIIDRLCVQESVATAAGTSAIAGNVSAGIGGTASEELPEGSDLTDEQRENLLRVYKGDIFPFLRDPESARSPLSDAGRARTFFEALRKQSPASVHDAIADLENICEEERQLRVQRRRYLLLHGWLLVHVPLSVTLLVLGAIHAIVALHY